jgi:spoIIIJ-associated protein
MDDQSIVRTAKTVEEAIELATLELGVDRDEIEVDVVSRGRAGILGIGAEPATVRVRLLGESGGSASIALGVVGNLLRGMLVEATPTIRSTGTGPDDPAVIDIQGDDAGLVIGRRGETLRALQFLANVVLSRHEDQPTRVVVDVESYRERRQGQLETIAKRMAQRAIADGDPIMLDAMPAGDRRIIHMTLADNSGVTTASSGEGSQRRVTITPTGQPGPRQSPGSGGGRRRRPPVRSDDRE